MTTTCPSWKSVAATVFAFVVAVASTATAQEQRSEVTGFIGYTASEGVKTNPGSKIGEVAEEVNPTSGFSYGFAYGFFLNEQAEVGFQIGQQMSTLELVGSSTRELADLKVNNYHGIFTYNVGDARDVVRPFVFGGLGATNYSADDIMGTSVESQTKFSSTWGGGVKVFPNPQVGVNLTARWTPTYIKSDAEGVYCSPYWSPYYPGGCVLLADPDYSNQFEISGGISFRF